MTDLPPLSDKDLEDIRFGIEHDIDMVAASFVRNAAGVDAIRAHIADCHAKYAPDPSAPPPLIISKVESTEALDRLGEIIEASDGLMVARGDLVCAAPPAAPHRRSAPSLHTPAAVNRAWRCRLRTWRRGKRRWSQSVRRRARPHIRCTHTPTHTTH